MVAVVGNLGPNAAVKELLADPKISSASYRLELYNRKGVEAIFFYL
jgi:hypothetical protein